MTSAGSCYITAAAQPRGANGVMGNPSYDWWRRSDEPRALAPHVGLQRWVLRYRAEVVTEKSVGLLDDRLGRDADGPALR